MEKESTPERPSGQTYDLSGMFSLALRLVVGWTYFSAFWLKISSFPVSNIRNKYVAKVKPGEHSLVIPLGAKAEINIEKNTSDIPTGIYKLELMDISGITWKTDIAKE